MPRAPFELITGLLRRAPAYCADAPVLGHWPAALGAQLMAWVEDDDRSVHRWARAIGALPIASPVPLDNVNRPEDLLAL
jgi:molybdopterin-guanine dinucleotide biosynthesis protein A